MKKTITAMLALLLACAMACPALAMDAQVTDGAGLLTQGEAAELEQRARQLAEQYDCAVYVITADTLDGAIIGQYHEAMFLEYGMGVGEDGSCISLLVDMDQRLYDLMGHGYGSAVLYGSAGDEIEESFLSHLGAGYYYDAFSAYLDACEEALALTMGMDITPGNYNQYQEDASGEFSLLGAAISVIFPLGAAFLVCTMLKNQMQTANLQTMANDYVPSDGFELTHRQDQFLHTTRTVRRIQRGNSGGGGRAGSGRRSGGFSHRGGRF